MTGAAPMLLLRNVALALGGFLLTAQVVGRFAPLPDDAVVRAKHAEWQVQRETVDTVFLGASLVQSGIITPRFDAALLAAGRTQHSFNDALVRMTFSEALFRARRLLADPPPRLRSIFLELAPFDEGIFRLYPRAERMRYWHDLRTTITVCWSVYHRGGSTPLRAREIAWHLRLFASRLVNLGDGIQSVRQALREETEEDRVYRELVARGRGYIPLEEEPSDAIQAMGRAFANDPSDLHRLVERMQRPYVGGRVVDAYQIAVLQRLLAEAEDAGVAIVPFVMPVPLWYPAYTAAAEQGLLPLLLSFNDPRAHPELYRASVRFDKTHLNREGAEMCTDLLAQRYLAWLRERD